MTVGSVLRSLLEASASCALWLQYLTLQVMSLGRLSTSTGDDVDSWVADFGLTRLPAASATGVVTMTSFNPNAQPSIIPDGVSVRTGDGSQTFSVVGGPYTRAVGIPSVDVHVQAATAGVPGNVGAGTVTVLGSAVPGIDVVANNQAFSGGTAAETDAALRLRFVQYINTRSQGTVAAFGFAIQSIQQGLSYDVLENVSARGIPLPGHVHVIVDDGSGAPAQELLDQVAGALDAVRAAGTTVSVAAPTVIGVDLVITVRCSAEQTFTDVQIQLQGVLTSYVNALGVGETLRYSRIASQSYLASPDLEDVAAVTVNGLTDDVGGAAGTVVRIRSIDVEQVQP
jgi:uncharacterized phage protein gp47/JayE